MAALPHFYDFKPDFISCTYGAGGTNAGRTWRCAGRSRSTRPLKSGSLHLHRQHQGRDHQRARAVSGHRRREHPGHARRSSGRLGQHRGDFSYADGLIRYIREGFSDFTIAAACYPEKHLSAPSFAADIAHLRSKQDAGAEFLLSQLCHDVGAF